MHIKLLKTSGNEKYSLREKQIHYAGGGDFVVLSCVRLLVTP